MNLDRLSDGAKLAGFSAMLLFVFTFFDWYGYEQGGNLLSRLELFVDSGNAWETLDVIPFVLALTIAVAIGAGLLALRRPRWEPAIPPSAAVAVLGAISFLLILYRIVIPPDLGDIADVPFHATPEFGIFLALSAAVGITVGGCRAMQEEGAVRTETSRV